MCGQVRSAFGRLVMVTFLVAMIALATVVPGAAQDQEQPESVTIDLNEYQESGVSGSATLTAEGDEVIVSSQIEGEMVTGDHPTHIHTGTCEDFDPDPTFPLNTVVLDPVDNEGVSETRVDAVSLDELLRGDWVILIHKSAEELTNYLVCGEIKAGGEDGQDTGQQKGVGGVGSTGGSGGHDTGHKPGTGSTAAVPASGAGTMAGGSDGDIALLTLIGTLAIAAAAAAVAIHRGRARA